MKHSRIFFSLTALIINTNILIAQEIVTIDYNRIFYNAEQKINSLIGEVNNYSVFPRSKNVDGSTKLVNAGDWTSGFFPGSLWYMYENTGADKYKMYAENWTNTIEPQKNNTGTHDLGFMLYCSFGNGLRLASIPNYSDVLITSANSLMTRVNPTVGCMKSWDWAKQWEYPVIIDNMMNLELLFWASRQTGDSKYYDAAVSHANTTILNHFRDDNSSYHVVDYNIIDGTVKSKETHQGYSDNSDWSRGQAWGLYGYTMSYRETKNHEFLTQAEKIASFIMNNENLPSDLIPYWDFKDPMISTNPDSVPRDVSAATITASALIELYEITAEEKYMVFASEILNTISHSKYTTPQDSNNNFILLHSTGSKPSNSEVSTSINYADYYYLEALTRYKSVMGVDFEPYLKYTDTMIIDANEEFVDDVIVYDIDNVGGFTVSLKNNPSFVALKDLGNNKYQITAMPTDSDSGNHKFTLSINYEGGDIVDKVIEYNVTSTLKINDINSSKYKVYKNGKELIVEGKKETRHIVVYSVLGDIVTDKQTSTNNRSIIDISDFVNGVYIYVIETTDGVTKGKFVVE